MGKKRRNRSKKRVVLVEERLQKSGPNLLTIVTLFATMSGLGLLSAGVLLQSVVLQAIGISLFIPGAIVAKGIQEVVKEKKDDSH